MPRDTEDATDRFVEWALLAALVLIPLLLGFSLEALLGLY